MRRRIERADRKRRAFPSKRVTTPHIPAQGGGATFLPPFTTMRKGRLSILFLSLLSPLPSDASNTWTVGEREKSFPLSREYEKGRKGWRDNEKVSHFLALPRHYIRFGEGSNLLRVPSWTQVLHSKCLLPTPTPPCCATKTLGMGSPLPNTQCAQ